MADRKSDHVLSLFLSVLLHGAVVALLVYGWWTFRHKNAVQPAQNTLAIEGTVIAPSPAPAPPKPPEPPPPAPEPQETGPPTPTAQERAQEEAERKAEAQRKEDERREAQEKKRAEQEAADKAAEIKRQAEKKKLEEQKRQAEEKMKQEEARQRAQREAELRRSLEQEQHVMAARNGGQLASWVAQITARIQRAWLRPPSARSGIDCMVYVTQVPGGEVTQVRVGSCNGDQSVRESIEAAVYRASPLPPPPDPALFERNLEIRFKPVD